MDQGHVETRIDDSFKQKSFQQRWFGSRSFVLRGFTFLATVVLFFNIGWLGELAPYWRHWIPKFSAYFAEEDGHLHRPREQFFALSSAVISVNEYSWAVVTPDFITGAAFNLTTAAGTRYRPSDKVLARYQRFQKEVDTYERLENEQCIRAYSSGFQTTRRDVALVSHERNITTSILAFGYTAPGSEYTNGWICSAEKYCNTRSISSTDWEVFGKSIDHCLSKKATEICSVQFSFKIMKVLIAFNVLKIVAMLYILFRFKAEELITTVGDAAMSFLQIEDQTTHHMCLANKRHLYRFWSWRRDPQPYTSSPGRWHRAVSKTRWVAFSLFFILCLAVVVLGFAMGFIFLREKNPSIMESGIRGLWDMGFGIVNETALIYISSESLIKTAITANVAQVCLAVIWTWYNGIICSMFISADWSTFAFKGQTLMVGSPTGSQRGTWLLGLPFKFGVPLMALHVLAHWIVSQSVFLAQAEILSDVGEFLQQVSDCGYSPIAIIFACIIGVLIFVTLLVFGPRRFKAGSPPIVSTCSAAISAACHPGTVLDEKAGYEKLRWADVGPGWNVGVGHCSIIPDRFFSPTGETNAYARPPLEGRLYA
ncbi:predicted protein [Uncinocarpus reesii 1704]|uniref:Uncharacterized protein n=1 Tax=Uncinocarpus reesii (strain UAMH 1704) TaxID=336963 RepID=C4JXW1_UNCRE|nr:uncharacterized protein UREG_07899 [Uncinocarpus reesii 1704]EEP83034.1 predicted protein [Uncinocarpus reesii 1704]